MPDGVRTPLRRRVLWAVPAALVPALLLFRWWNPPAPALLVTLAAIEKGAAHDGEAAGHAMVRVEVGGGQPQGILNGFATTGTPTISNDGRRALFAGRRMAGDPMQIWEVSLSGSVPRMIVASGECLDPAYLPDGRIVFTRSPPAAGSEAASLLYTALPDGREERPITFGDARDRAPTVLPDGRVAFRRELRDPRSPGRLFVINPDGTGMQIFCNPAEGASIEAGPWLVRERVVFAERPLTGAGQRLVAVSTRQPLGDRQILNASDGFPNSDAERFSSVAEFPDGGLIAAAYGKERGWALVQLAPSAAPLRSVAFDPFRPIAVALAAPRTRPLSLTSVVDERKSTGTLLCLDVRASRDPSVARAAPEDIRAVRVLAADGLLLNEAPVEVDGSFFVEVPADRPLRLELRGAEGVVAADHSRFWVRPNENRGCIGCHEDPESAPENRAVRAVDRGPTRLAATGANLRTEGHAP